MRVASIVIPTIFVAMATLPLSAESAWADGVSKSRGWVDINKNWTTDKFHCWAAAASNIIAWWQQKIESGKIPAGTPKKAEDIFEAISSAFIDSGRGSNIAWKWYFGGCDLADICYRSDFRNPGTARTSGRFWQNNVLRKYGWPNPRYAEPAYIQSGVCSDVSPEQRNSETLAETFVRLFGEGKGITLDLTPGGSFPMGHTVTLWGIEYQKNRIKAVYITDSDDGETKLKKYDVAYVSTKETSGDGKSDGTPITTWEKTSIRLLGYCGQNAYGLQTWVALGLPLPAKATKNR